MPKVLILIGLITILSLETKGQSASDSAPRLELFGGYSSLHTDFVGRSSPFPLLLSVIANDRMHGWNASVSLNVTGWMGLVADFSGHYGSSFDTFDLITSPNVERASPHFYSYLFGPRVSLRKHSRITPFGQSLFGAVRAKIGSRGIDGAGERSDTGFGLSLGGGIDVKISDWLAIRPVQAEYLQSRTFDERDFPPNGLPPQHNMRISSGLVFRFGKQD